MDSEEHIRCVYAGGMAEVRRVENIAYTPGSVEWQTSTLGLYLRRVEFADGSARLCRRRMESMVVVAARGSADLLLRLQ